MINHQRLSPLLASLHLGIQPSNLYRYLSPSSCFQAQSILCLLYLRDQTIAVFNESKVSVVTVLKSWS
jgi:hypothetical protein